MPLVTAAIVLHVGMGAFWTLASLAGATAGLGRPSWLRLLLGVALINALAGIYLWHALHAGHWGPAEHLLVVGTFCALFALGLQVPINVLAETNRHTGPSLVIYRVSAGALLVAAVTMIGAHWA